MAKISKKPSHIATIGYEKAGFGDFVQCLKEAGIARVLDVRELPLSRRAGFSKRQLEASLLEAGIAYTHLKGLGTPKEGRVAARSGRMDEFRSIFASHMKTDRAQNELSLAVEMVQKELCCLLCFEADHACCHRAVVSAALCKKTGLPIENLVVIH